MAQKQCEHHVDRMEAVAIGLLEGTQSLLRGCSWWQFSRRAHWQGVVWMCKRVLEHAKEVRVSAVKADQELIWKYDALREDPSDPKCPKCGWLTCGGAKGHGCSNDIQRMPETHQEPKQRECQAW